MDLALVETGNGGDLVMNGNILEMVYGVENMPYIACFGGNVGHPEKEYKAGEQRFSWWGNSLFFAQSKAQQISSLLEDKLINTALNSSGRIEIEQTMKEDLRFMLDFVDSVEVDATIISDDQLRIVLKVFLATEIIVKVVEYKAKEDVDFVFDDFNDDFYVA